MLKNIKMLKGKGFTLVELLVVTGIIVLLSAIILPNYQSIARQFALQRSAHKLAQDIRRVEEMAMSTKEFQGEVPKGGYGICFKLSWGDYYKIYADKNGNEKFDEEDGEMETLNLERGIYIKDISPSSLSINFKSPIPTVKIKTEAGQDSATAIITLSLKSDSTKIKIIKVNSIGLIDVE